MATKIASLVLRKETKGALMFAEVDAQGNDTIDLCGTFYIRKSALAGAKPQTIKVSVEY